MSNKITIDEERWASVQARGLDKGDHDDIAVGMCAMEAASYIVREPWSDHPRCVCPVIAAFMRSWNDGLPDDERALILPLIPATIGTRGSYALAERRSLMAADWLVRTHTVAWLRLAKLDASADALASLPEITSMAQVPSIRGPLEAVQRDAAGSAAGSAARDAAWDAAWAAAWDAAWDAAGSAAGDALAPTKATLQRSAYDLIERMCALTDADLAADRLTASAG